MSGKIIDITTAVNKEARKKLERLVGSALREGASEDVILIYLEGIGATDPERLIARVKSYKTLPQLGDGELTGLGGRAKVREQFSLPPEPTEDAVPRVLVVEDFVAYMPDHSYYCIATQEFWVAPSVLVSVQSPKDDCTICEYLDRYRRVEQLTWMPGEGAFIKDTIVADGGIIHRPGLTVLNTYRPPQPCRGGDPGAAGPWLEHFYRIYPTDAEHMIKWLAHRVQRPNIKINHALVWGGAMRIGKDTLLVPVRRAVGEWNCNDVGPDVLMGRFNGYLKSVLLRVNEARDLGEFNRYTLYEHCKALLASPPETHRVDEKNRPEHQVPNIIGVIFTTNHLEGGLYLPPDDARHYVAWSDAQREDFPLEYWNVIQDWYYAKGGIEHVMAYLQQPSLIEGWDPKRPPPQTQAWRDMVNSNRSAEESEVADLIDLLKNPEAFTIGDLIHVARDANTVDSIAMAEWLGERKNAKAVPRKIEACGYVNFPNPDSTQGIWSIDGKRQAIYVRRDLPHRERERAVKARQHGPKAEAPNGGIPY